MPLAGRSAADYHIARLPLRRVLMANREHVLAQIRVDNRRPVFDLEAKASPGGERKEFVRNVDHLVAARVGGVSRHNVAVECGTAMLESRLGFRCSGDQVELLQVQRSVLKLGKIVF